MRISDWSSDVCSSDLLNRRAVAAHLAHHAFAEREEIVLEREDDEGGREDQHPGGGHAEPVPERNPAHHQGAGDEHQQDRKSVVSGKSVSVRVDLGGRRILKKKNNSTNKLHSNN